MILQVEPSDGPVWHYTVTDLFHASREIASLGDFKGQWLVLDDPEYGQEVLMRSENYEDSFDD